MSETSKPLPSLGFITVARSKPVMIALIKVIKAIVNRAPDWKMDSESASRALYDPALARYTCNTASDHMHRKLGRHDNVLAFDNLENPLESANIAAGIFVERGFTAHVIDDAEPEAPVGLLVFVKVPELYSTLLLFRPSPSAYPVGFTPPPRFPWKDEDFEISEP